MARWLLAAALLMAVATVYFSTRGDDALAAGPCGTSHDAMNAEEQQFLNLLQQWRSSSGVSNEPVEVSGALNQAAAWFAEWQVTNNALGGHSDSFGRSWVQRAIDCGYTNKLTNGTYWATASGEGVFGAAANGAGVGPTEALQGMLAQGAGHSGIYMYGSPPNFPAKCYGVAVYRNGDRVAWVVVIAQLQFNIACPGGSGGGGTPLPTASATQSATKTPTITPTATPTRKPVFQSWFSQLARD